MILDEPTNDLDIQTLTILEDYLDRFDGIIIIVSHDRYFLDRTVNRIFSFEGNGVIRQFEGGYSDYLIRKELESPDVYKRQDQRRCTCSCGKYSEYLAGRHLRTHHGKT